MCTTKSGFEAAFPGQHEHEAVVLLFRQHPLVMRKTLIFGLFIILFAVVPLIVPNIYDYPQVADTLWKIAGLIPVIVLLVWAMRWVAWYYSVFIVTDQRILVITQKGLFDRRVEEWQLEAITNLNYHVGGFQAVLFDYGDIVAKTYIGDFEMKTLHKPAKIHEQLLKQVRKAGGAGSTPGPNNGRMGKT